MKATLVKSGFYGNHLFITLEENGQKKYYLDGNEIDKEDGNEYFLNIVNCKIYGKNVKVTKLTKEDALQLAEENMSRYDKYVCYIDDYKQCARQEAINNEVWRKTELLIKCFDLDFDIYKYL